MAKYRKSPLIEVISEVRFVPNGSEDATLIGLIYNELKADFPIKQTVPVLAPFSEERTQFFTEDGRICISLAPTVVSISHLAPYQTWTDYRPFILRGLKAYLDASAHDTTQRVGLRYINRISIEAGASKVINTEDYVNFTVPHVPVPEDREVPMIGYIMAAQYPRNEGRDILKLQVNGAPSQSPTEAAMVLDLECFTANAGALGVTDVMPWFDESNTVLERYFEAIVTSKLKEQFEPYE